MKGILVAVSVALVCGCAQAEQATTSGAAIKAQANDQQARIFTLMACDLSLGGLRREVPPVLKQAVLEHCLQADAPDE